MRRRPWMLGPEDRGSYGEAEDAEGFFRDLLGGTSAPWDESLAPEHDDAGGWSEADRFFSELWGEALEPGEAARGVGGPSLVRWVQQMLVRAGVGPVTDDGVLGPQTRGALQRFQQQRGLRRDSRLLSDTLHALAVVGGTVPPGVWPGAVPSHRGRTPDLSTPCPEPPAMLDRFAFGGYQPTAEHRTAVASLAQTIAASWSSDAPVHMVCLEGHTDSVGAQDPNLNLGQRRADAIQTELVAALDRAQPGLSARVGTWSTTAGETKPRMPNDSAANRALNRRVELRLNRRWRGPSPRTTVFIGLVGAPDRATEDLAGSSLSTIDVPVGGSLRIEAKGRPLPVGTPAYTWVSADPAIATVTSRGTAQSHPNQVEIRGQQIGRTIVTVTYRPQSGPIGSTKVVVTVGAAV